MQCKDAIKVVKIYRIFIIYYLVYNLHVWDHQCKPGIIGLNQYRLFNATHNAILNPFVIFKFMIHNDISIIEYTQKMDSEYLRNILYTTRLNNDR